MHGRPGYAGNFTETFHGNNVATSINVNKAEKFGLDSAGVTYGLHIRWEATFKSACETKTVHGQLWNNDPLPKGVVLKSHHRAHAQRQRRGSKKSVYGLRMRSHA
jgi:hypothetical protein